MGLRPPSLVWYVNGYLAELYLRHDVNYTFILEGGKGHAFYISGLCARFRVEPFVALILNLHTLGDPNGGHSRLLEDEQAVSLAAD